MSKTHSKSPDPNSKQHLSDLALSDSPTEETIALHQIRHKCLPNCGKCCESRFLGPLDDEYLKRAPDLHKRLSEIYPELQNKNPYATVEFNGQELKVMSITEQGACIYLGNDRLCRMHKHFGLSVKAIACRYYPITQVQTEDSLRIGVTSRCQNSHKTFNNGEIISPADLTGLSEEEMPPPDPRGLNPLKPNRMILNPKPHTTAFNNKVAEEELLSLLHHPDAGLEMVFAYLYTTILEKPLPVSPLGVLNSLSTIQPIIKALKTFGERLKVAHKDFSTEPGTYRYQVSNLINFLCNLSEKPFSGLTPQQKEYAVYVLKEWVFLREWHYCKSINSSVMCMLLGVITAHFRAQESTQDDTMECFAYTLTTWIRIIRGQEFFLLFSDSADLRQLFEEINSTFPAPRDSSDHILKRIITAPTSCIVDLQDSVKTHAFLTLSEEDKQGPQKAVSALYKFFDRFHQQGHRYLNPTFMEVTSLGRLYLRTFLSKSSLPTIPTVFCTTKSRSSLEDQLKKLSRFSPCSWLIKKSVLPKKDVLPLSLDEAIRALEHTTPFDTFQPLMVHSDDRGRQKIFRILVVNSKVIGAFEHTATKPLEPSILISGIPNNDQLQPQSENYTPISIDPDQDLISLGLEAQKRFEEAERRFRHEYKVHTSFNGLDWCCVDIIKSSSGELMVESIRLLPDLNLVTITPFVGALIKFLGKLTSSSEIQKVQLIGNTVLEQQFKAQWDKPAQLIEYEIF